MWVTDNRVFTGFFIFFGRWALDGFGLEGLGGNGGRLYDDVMPWPLSQLFFPSHVEQTETRPQASDTRPRVDSFSIEVSSVTSTKDFSTAGC